MTKEQNDVSIYLPAKNKWVKVHSTTNNLYDPSPTIKRMPEDSPTIVETKRRKNLRKAKKAADFSLGIKSTQC